MSQYNFTYDVSKEMLETLKATLAWMNDNPPPKAKRGDLDATYRNAIFYRERERIRRAIQAAEAGGM